MLFKCLVIIYYQFGDLCHLRKQTFKSNDFVLFYFAYLLVCLFIVFFRDRVSLCNSPDCHGTHSLCRPGWPQTQRPNSVSRMLGLKECATTAQRSAFI